MKRRQFKKKQWNIKGMTHYVEGCCLDNYYRGIAYFIYNRELKEDE